MRKPLRTPSPAMLVACLALFVALGGVSYAAATIHGKNIKNGTITGKKLKNRTITAAKIRDRTITAAKVRNNTLTGAQIDEARLGKVPSAASADTAATANDAAALGGQPASSFLPKANVRWAVVAPAGPDPTIVRGAGAIAVTRISNGYYGVTFDRDMTDCAWSATYGRPDNLGVTGRFATVRGVEDPTTVGVVLRNPDGAQSDGDGFHLVAICP